MTILDWLYIGWCLAVALCAFALGLNIGRSRGERTASMGDYQIGYQAGYQNGREVALAGVKAREEAAR